MSKLKAEKIERDSDGYWYHSGVPFWDEEDWFKIEDEVARWKKENGVLRFKRLNFEDDNDFELQKRYYEDNDATAIKDWNPEIKDWNSEYDNIESILIAISDSEDGPIAIFAILYN